MEVHQYGEVSVSNIDQSVSQLMTKIDLISIDYKFILMRLIQPQHTYHRLRLPQKIDAVKLIFIFTETETITVKMIKKKFVAVYLTVYKPRSQPRKADFVILDTGGLGSDHISSRQ